MSKLKMIVLLFVLLSPALAFADCGEGKYKDCRCSLAVNNGFQNVSDVTADYCCQYGCGGMGFNGDSRCCTGAEQGKTWVDGSCKTPCSSVTCPSGQEKNGQTYKETTGTCCKDAKPLCANYICPGEYLKLVSAYYGNTTAECCRPKTSCTVQILSDDCSDNGSVINGILKTPTQSTGAKVMVNVTYKMCERGNPSNCTGGGGNETFFATVMTSEQRLKMIPGIKNQCPRVSAIAFVSTEPQYDAYYTAQSWSGCDDVWRQEINPYFGNQTF